MTYNFTLEAIDGQRVKWAVDETDFHTDERGNVVAFKVNYNNGSSEHFILSDDDTIHHVINWLDSHLSYKEGMGLGAAAGMLKGARGFFVLGAVGLAAKAVLHHFSGVRPGGAYYYYDGNKRARFLGPIVLT